MQSVSEAIKSTGFGSIPWIPRRSAQRTPSIGLRCPECQGFLIDLSYRALARGNSSAYCTGCGVALEQDQGIWQGLPKSRHAHYVDFVESYERYNWGSGSDTNDMDFYLALPSCDHKRDDGRRWARRAKTFRCLQNEILAEMAGEGGSPLTILDLGAGSGWMSHRLAGLGHRPIAVDLLTNSVNGLGAASHYRCKLLELFPRFQAEFDNLPFADEQFDCAIFNASFQYSENYDRTIGEATRCLRPGGVLIIADSPLYSVESGGPQLQQRSGEYDLEDSWLSTEGLVGREYLTPERLLALEARHEFKWSTHRCWYGFRWACRPWLAKWRGSAEPPQLVLYSAQVKVR